MLKAMFQTLKASFKTLKASFKTLKASFKTLKANIFLRGISTYTSIRRITKDEDMTS